MLSQRAWTWIGPTVMCLIDVGVTLACQPAKYWQEGYRFVHEANPVARWLLAIDPFALVAGNLLWILLFSTVIVRLPFRSARVVALVILIAHALGASTWLIRQPYGWLWCLAVWVLARSLFALFWDGPRRGPVKPDGPAAAR